jgi:hypothetical protein
MRLPVLRLIVGRDPIVVQQQAVSRGAWKRSGFQELAPATHTRALGARMDVMGLSGLSTPGLC